MPRQLKRRWSDQKWNILRGAAARMATIPLAILVAAALAYSQRAALPASAAATLGMASYIVAAVGMALSAGFNRSRVFFVLLLVVLAQIALAASAPASLDPKVFATEMNFFAALLLPFNILAFSLSREKGLLSPAGKGRAVFLLVQLFVAVVLIAAQDVEIALFVIRDSAALSPQSALPYKAALMFALAAAVLGVKQFRSGSPVDSAMFYALFALAAAFHFQGPPITQPLFFAATAVMLTVAAIQDSYSIAYRDELTGLPSRRALQEELARLGDSYAIAMVDIDHFKKLNDSYGHDVGDDVLRLVAAVIRDGAVEGRAFRYGGEEFTLVFPGKSAEEVWSSLEEMRDRIAKRAFVVRGTAAKKRLTVTVSIGVAERSGRLAAPAEVVKAADEALYRAKDQGRNRVCN